MDQHAKPDNKVHRDKAERKARQEALTERLKVADFGQQPHEAGAEDESAPGNQTLQIATVLRWLGAEVAFADDMIGLLREYNRNEPPDSSVVIGNTMAICVYKQMRQRMELYRAILQDWQEADG